MIIEKRSAIILTLVIIMITSAIPTTILSVSVVEAGKEKDDNNGKDKDDDQLTEHDLAVLCGASEDYEANKEQCDKLYDMLEEGVIKDDPDFEYD
jgi:hypothetical protein